MQTPKEVIDALVRKGNPERMGFMDSPWADTLRQWVRQGYPADDEGNPVSPAEHFGFDMVGCAGVDWMPIPGVSEIVEETAQWKIVHDGSGATLKWWKERSGTPEHVAFEMTTPEIWRGKYRPHLVGTAPERARAKADEVKQNVDRWRARQRWTHYGGQFIWENMRHSLGDVCLYESMALRPEWIRDIARVYADYYKQWFSTLFKEAGRPDGVWLYEDLGYKHRTFCSPRMYAELIFPYFAELVELCHAHDLPVVLHTCGYTESVLDLIVEAGFDGLHPMEVKAGNRPLRIADTHGERLCLIGGLDVRILESGDREWIRRGVTDLLEGMKRRGARYVYASDHSISTNVDYDDFRFAVDVYREQMAY